MVSFLTAVLVFLYYTGSEQKLILLSLSFIFLILFAVFVFLQDLKKWVQDKPEVEVVDMVLKIKNKIHKCQQHDIPVSNSIKEQLGQRLEDIICTLPDDLKNILSTS